MNKIALLLIISSCLLDSSNQSEFKVYNAYELKEIGRSFKMGHVIRSDLEIMNDREGKLYYELPGISRDLMSKSKPVNMIIRISDLEGKKISDIEIQHNDVDIDLSWFQIHHLSQRKFLVFTVGRYRFYILNLANNKVIGPIKPKVEGEASDSQDGTIHFTEVFNDGQYLVGYANNMGMFCYNLKDLYDPIQVNHICTENQHNHSSYFFLDKRQGSMYNGLCIKNHVLGKYDSLSFLFQGKTLELSEDGSPLKSIIDNRYLHLNSYTIDGTSEPIIIDYQNGVLKR
jgi:hypothetical protein